MTPDRGSQTRELVELARYLDINSVQRVNGSRIFGELADALEAQSAQIATLQAEVERLGKIIAFKDRLIAVKDRHIDDAEKALDAVIERRRAEAAARKGEAG